MPDFKLGTAYVDVYPDTRKMKPGFDSAKRIVKGSIASMQKRINSISFRNIANSARRFITPLRGMFISLGASMSMALGVNLFRQYELSLNAMGRVTRRNLSEIDSDIKGFSAGLGTHTQLLGGYYNVLSAGVRDLAESYDTLVVAAKMAAVAQVPQKDVVRGLATLYKSYKDEIEDFSYAASFMFKIEERGITTVAELIPYIGSLASMTAEAGVKLSAFGAVLAEITSITGETSISATMLRGLIMAMLTPTEQLADVFVQYGSALDAIKQIGFVESMKLIAKAADGNKEALARMIPEQRALLGFLALSKNNFAGLEETMKEFSGDLTGFADEWGKYQKTVDHFLTKTKNTVSNVMKDITEVFVKTIREIKSGENIDDIMADVAINVITAIQKIIKGFDWLHKSYQGIRHIIGLTGLVMFSGRETDAANMYLNALEEVSKATGKARDAAEQHAERLKDEWKTAQVVRQIFHEMWDKPIGDADTFNQSLKMLISNLEDLKVKMNEVDMTGQKAGKSGKKALSEIEDGANAAAAALSEVWEPGEMERFYQAKKILESKAERETKDTATTFKDAWEDALKTVGNMVEDLIVGFIQGTNNMKDVILGAVSEIAGLAGTAIGTAIGGPVGGYIGGTLGKIAGAGISALFGGEKTVYEETGGAAFGRVDGGLGLTSLFAASNEHGGALASELNSYVENALSDVNEKIVEALEKATPAQVQELEKLLDAAKADLGALYESGFFGYSISEKTKDRAKDLKGITDNIQYYINEATVGIEDFANSISEAAIATAKAAEESKALEQAMFSALRMYDQVISGINARMTASLTPWQSLSSSVAGQLEANKRSDWEISDYINELNELILSGDESVDILNKQVGLLEQITALTEQDLQQTKAFLASIAGTIFSFTGGSLASVQSASAYGLRYQELLSSAFTSVSAAEEFSGFAAEYADFMKATGADYNLVVKEIISDLEAIRSVFENKEQQLATNEMLLQTTMSTNSLLEAILHKADQQIAAIKEQADAETAAADAAYAAAQQALLSSAKAIIGEFMGTYGGNPEDISYWAGQLIGSQDIGTMIKNMTGIDPTLEMFSFFNKMGFGQHGGLMSSPTIGGEKGPEWFVPTYEPERSSFLKNVGADPKKIGQEIVKQLIMADSSRGGGSRKIQLKVKSRILGDVIADEIDSQNPRLLTAIARVR